MLQDSPFCEVLGREQRAWLQRELDRSTASLRLIVSGSVVLGRPVRIFPINPPPPSSFAPPSVFWRSFLFLARAKDRRPPAVAHLPPVFQAPRRFCRALLWCFWFRPVLRGAVRSSDACRKSCVSVRRWEQSMSMANRRGSVSTLL